MTQHFGVCEWSFPVSGPLAIQLAAAAGYEGMQVGEAGGRRMGFPLNDPRVCAAYRESAEACHVRLHSLNLGALLAEGTMNYAAETQEGAWARESLEHGFAACRTLGVEDVVITVDAPDAEAEANAVEHLRYARQLAADSGVVIAMESALPLPDIQRILDKAGHGLHGSAEPPPLRHRRSAGADSGVRAGAHPPLPLERQPKRPVPQRGAGLHTAGTGRRRS